MFALPARNAGRFTAAAGEEATAFILMVTIDRAHNHSNRLKVAVGITPASAVFEANVQL